MKDNNKEFYTEGCNTELVDVQVKAFDELVEAIMLEALQHMTSTEKLDQAKYRRSAKGKKALLKHKKKIEKAGYRVDKKRSKLMQKVADFRNEAVEDDAALLEFDLNDEVLVNALWESLEAEDLAFFDGLVEEVCAFLEACKDEDCDCEDEEDNADDEESVDPETGEEEELEEGFKHMTATAKQKAKKYRMSAAGKKAIKKYLKKASRAGYKVDKALSKLMTKVGAFAKHESEDMDFAAEMGISEAELAGLDEFVGYILANANELLEGEEIDLDENIQIELPFENKEALEEALIEGVEIISEEDGNFVLEGKEEDICAVLEELGFDEDAILEFTIHHQTAAERLASKARRKQPKFKMWMKKYLKKRKMPGFRVNKALSKKMKKVAALRREAIEESLDASFAATPLFESLNEGESNELKGIVFNAVSSILDQSYEKIAEDVTNEYEAYMTEEAMPEMVRVFEEYSAEIVKNLNEEVEAYLDYVAESIVDELEGKNLIVKSQKSEALESFSEDLLALIKDKLNIIPEQEDLLQKNRETIKSLSEQVQDAKAEAILMKNKVEEQARKMYVLESTPAGLSDFQKENLNNYVEDVLSEAEDFDSFKNGFDAAIKELKVSHKEEQKVVVEKKEEKKSFSGLFESLERMGRI